MAPDTFFSLDSRTEVSWIGSADILKNLGKNCWIDLYLYEKCPESDGEMKNSCRTYLGTLLTKAGKLYDTMVTRRGNRTRYWTHRCHWILCKRLGNQNTRGLN